MTNHDLIRETQSLEAKSDPQSPSTVQSSKSFVFERTFFTSPQELFSAWTEPDKLSQWFGPKDFTISECKVDLYVGGNYRIVMRSNEGIDYPVVGTFQTLEPARRIVMTDIAEGHPNEWMKELNSHRAKPSDRTLEAVNEIRFEALENGRTHMRLETIFPTQDERQAAAKLGCIDGWNESLDKLGHLVSRLVA